MTEYAAIIPLLIVALAGAAAMLAEAFRQPGERMPIAGLGLIGLAGAAVASVFLWDTDRSSFGVIRADNFSLFINLILCVVGVLTMLFSNDLVERERLPAGEYYALTLRDLRDVLCRGHRLLVISSRSRFCRGVLRAHRHPGAIATAPRPRSSTSFSGLFEALLPYGIAFLFAVRRSTRPSRQYRVVGPGRRPANSRMARRRIACRRLPFQVPAGPFHRDAGRLDGAPTIVTAFCDGVRPAFGVARVPLALEPLQAQWVPVLA